MFYKDKEKIKCIAKKYKISLVVLFGSSIRSKNYKGNDKDLALLLKSINIDKSKLLFELTNLFPHEKIDILILNRTDPLSQYEVASKGIPIYEEEKGDFKHFQLLSIKRNDDGKKFYDLEKLYINRFIKGEYTRARSRCYPPKIGQDGRLSQRTRADNKSKI